MMESPNFRTEMSESLVRTTQAALAEIFQKSVSHHPEPGVRPTRLKSLPRAVKHNRDRWLVAAHLLTSEPPKTAVPVGTQQWLLSGNPRLAKLVTAAIGNRWIEHVEELEQLTPIADEPLFQSHWQMVKLANKQALAQSLKRSQGIEIDVNSRFDLHLQPIGAHHRQLLNILHIINLIDRLKQSPDSTTCPQTFIFGELVPSALEPTTAVDEELNRSIIELIRSLANIIAADRDLCHKLQVVYIPAAAEWAHQLYAAADVTEQIATPAIEDVDLTKLQATINGVISIGSLGKTNHWLQQMVGEDNCFRFGLAIPEIALFKEYGYDPYNYYKHYPQIRQAIDYLFAGYLTPHEPNLGRSIVNTLMGADEQMAIADYIFYAACQAHVSATYEQPSLWTQMSILNVAGVR